MTHDANRDPKDYSWLPADVQAFIARTEASYPADAVNFTIAEQRDFYNKLCADFSPPYPPGVTARDVMVAGVPCRDYTPSALHGQAVVIYFHGGGFILGGLDSHDSICAELADGAGLRLISVDYRLVPEHRHPAAYDDCLAVVDATAGPKILAGDSAGGNLAAAVSAARPDAGIIGQVLIYPGLGGSMDLPSYSRHAFAPMLTRADVEFYAEWRFDGPRTPGDVTAAPLEADQFDSLPPTAIFTAQADPLASDGVEYAARLAEAGVPVSLTEEPGQVHGYLRARSMAAGALASFQRIIAAMRAMSDGTFGQ